MTADKWVNPFDIAPTKGSVVLYHHPTDGVDWPAIVCDVRLRDKTGYNINVGASEELVRHADESNGPLSTELRLTVFRPGAIEWHWSSESTEERGWSWPVKNG